MVKNLSVRATARDVEKGVATLSVFLPGKSHRQRVLVGYRPWGPTELDTLSAAPQPITNSTVFFSFFDGPMKTF